MKVGNIAISPVNMEQRRKIDIKPGDTVRVWQKVQEKDKTRLQPFEGVVLARKHGTEAGATFTVRRVNDSYGTEKIFPLYSPMIDKIEVIRRARMKRAKLYHIRKKAAREIKRQMRNMMFVDIATESDMEEQARKEAEAQEAEQKEQEVKETPAEDVVEESKATEEAKEEQPIEEKPAEEAVEEKES